MEVTSGFEGLHLMKMFRAFANHFLQVTQLSARVRLDADTAGVLTRPRFGSGRGVVERIVAPLRLGTGGALFAMSMPDPDEISAHDFAGLSTAPPEVQPAGGGALAGAAARRVTMRLLSCMSVTQGSPGVQPRGDAAEALPVWSFAIQSRDEPARSPAVQPLDERAPIAGAAGGTPVNGIERYVRVPFTIVTRRDKAGGWGRGRTMREVGGTERGSVPNSSGVPLLLLPLTALLAPLPLPLASKLLFPSLLPLLLLLPARVVVAGAAWPASACLVAVVVVVVGCVE